MDRKWKFPYIPTDSFQLEYHVKRLNTIYNKHGQFGLFHELQSIDKNLFLTKEEKNNIHSYLMRNLAIRCTIYKAYYKFKKNIHTSSINPFTIDKKTTAATKKTPLGGYCAAPSHPNGFKCPPQAPK